MWHLPAVKRGDGPELRALAEAYRHANAPASSDERRTILGELRLATILRNESIQESRDSFRRLMADLADLPADILRAACKAYVNTPGQRFFPRSAGEIREFSNPLQIQRSRRAYRLGEMAKAADDAFDPADRCTKEDAAAIMAEFGLRSESREEMRRHQGPPQNPTRQDYIDMGMDPAVLDKLEADRSATAGHVSTRAA